jgi:hypothetical protein
MNRSLWQLRSYKQHIPSRKTYVDGIESSVVAFKRNQFDEIMPSLTAVAYDFESESKSQFYRATTT